MFAIITATLIFTVGMLIMNHLMADVSIARTVGIDCSDPNLSSGAQITCIGFDLVIPVCIITIVSISAGAVLSRFII